MQQEIQLDIIEKMLRASSSNHYLISSFGLLIPRQGQRVKCLTMAILGVIPSYLIATSVDTINIFKNCVQILNDIILAVFGIVFTGYALFQALIGKEMLIRMLQTVCKKKGKEISKLQESNELFAEMMMLDFICIFINVILLLVLNIIPDDYSVFDCVVLNNTIAGIGIWLYFYVLFNAIIEIKSFIYNIVELFNFHAGTRVIELMQGDSEGDE